MKRKVRKKIIGILGGIGSGKSTAARLLGELGCAVIDADQIAHRIIEKKLLKKELQRNFGSGIINKNGKIDHKRLAEAAFVSREKVACLNRLIHPPVLAKIEQLINKYVKKPNVKAIVLDMPLLAEIGWTKRCDTIIFVRCGLQERLKRCQKRHYFDKNRVKKIEKYQISIDKKAKIADNIVDNKGSIANLKEQIALVFRKIMEQ